MSTASPKARSKTSNLPVYTYIVYTICKHLECKYEDYLF